MKDAQKTATQVFITTSVLFGIVGVVMMLSAPGEEDPPAWMFKILGTLVFVILSSFGVSIGLKYLSSK